MDTRHPQVPVLWFQCDGEIADLITLMNYCGIRTVNSCQDNRYNRGTVRRVWVEILGEDLLRFLSILDRPGEVDELDSLSHRMATEWNPDSQEDLWDFRENRAWHYLANVSRSDGELVPLTISIRFPYTDLPEVVTRLRAAAMELDGRIIRRPSDESPDQEESNSEP